MNRAVYPARSRSLPMTWRRLSAHSLLFLLMLAALLIALRLALPYRVRNTINIRLDKLGEYHSHLDDIDIHLWRGAYAIMELEAKEGTPKGHAKPLFRNIKVLS